MNKTFHIHVVEDHNDVLERIYKDIGRKCLNFKDLTMIHFDSHPDLGIPEDFDADLIFNRDKLMESLSIENWILPAVYAGHISKIAWVKPKWAKQINAGLFDIVVGKNLKNNQISCNCSESYFLGDKLYSNENNLVNKKNFQLYVCDFDTILNAKDPILNDFIGNACKNLILDIDLDFFSTRDPFREIFNNNDHYDLFKRVYKTKPPSFEDEDFEVKYKVYLAKKSQKLEEIYKYLTSKEHSKLSKNTDLKQLKELYTSRNYDIEILHNYGCGIDDCSLPHNVSTQEDIIQMLNQLTYFLNNYFSLQSLLIPGSVTIARSSLDDYCPSDQVDFIQEGVISKVKTYFGPEKIKSVDLCYDL